MYLEKIEASIRRLDWPFRHALFVHVLIEASGS